MAEAKTVVPPEKEKKDEAPQAATKITPPPEAKPAARRRRTTAKKPHLPTMEERLLEFFGEYKIKEIETDRGTVGVPYCTGIAGLGWVFNQQDGFVIATNSANMARAWANLAASNERVARALEWMMAGGAWGEVFWATSPVILGIMANHGVTLASFGMGAPAADADGEPGGGSGDQAGPVASVPPSVP